MQARPPPPSDRIASPSLRLDDAGAFGRLFDRFADAKVVLLGEATHGTSEFYRARAAITRRLIERARLQHRRRRGGLARRHPHRPLRPPPAAAGRPTTRRSRASRPGCGATSRSTTSSIGCATTTNALAARSPGRVPRPRPLQPALLDRGGPRLSRRGRSGGSQGRARALRLPVALARGPGALWPRGALWRQEAVRAEAARPAPRASREAARLRERATARISSMPCRTPASSRAAEHYYRIMYQGSTESWNLRDRHMFDTLQALLDRRGDARQGRRLGAQLPYRQCRRDRHGLAGRVQHRRVLPHGVSRRGGADRFRHRPRHGRGGERLGRADADQDRAAVAGPTATSACSCETGMPASLTDWRPHERAELRELLSRSRLERAIGVIYRPETRALQPLFRSRPRRAVRRLRVVRGNQGRDASGARPPRRRPGHVPVRPLTPWYSRPLAMPGIAGLGARFFGKAVSTLPDHALASAPKGRP